MKKSKHVAIKKNRHQSKFALKKEVEKFIMEETTEYEKKFIDLSVSKFG